jgi:hypothetical protein
VGKYVKGDLVGRDERNRLKVTILRGKYVQKRTISSLSDFYDKTYISSRQLFIDSIEPN